MRGFRQGGQVDPGDVIPPMAEQLGNRLSGLVGVGAALDEALVPLGGTGVPICYNKDKSGNPLKIKENRTCPYSFSSYIPGKIRSLKRWTERGCYVRDKKQKHVPIHIENKIRQCKGIAVPLHLRR